MAWTWIQSKEARAVRVQTERARDLGPRKVRQPSWLDGLCLVFLGFVMAIVGAKLLGNAHLWMTAERVRGEVIDHGERSRGGYRPIVRATIGEHTFRLRFDLPDTTEPPPVGSAVTVLVPRSGAVDARVNRARELFLMPGIGMLMATGFFGALAAALKQHGLRRSR